MFRVWREGVARKEASVHERAEASCRDEAGFQHVQRISAGRLIGPEFVLISTRTWSRPRSPEQEKRRSELSSAAAAPALPLISSPSLASPARRPVSRPRPRPPDPAQTQANPKSTPASSNYLHDLVVANSTPHLPHLAIFIIITAPVTSLPRVFSLSRSC
ncbi:hypothetical protein CEP52_012579 [Fusarium oligoseptatum]|uniref:Uncharacterized protein n=1 Tax=Fusarium oligoseptatum TaxID=2604345 RepID=A0A428SXM8_9HYPO|nr:hypothetical protein CEP52_012579 [Fusarium oligoseptatum]